MVVSLFVTVLLGTLALAQAGDVSEPAAEPGRSEPQYVIVAIDVSGSMESSDAPATDVQGRRLTLRDEGQLLFMQLLPYVHSNLYIGISHFSDKVRYSLPSEETGPLLSWGQTYLSESACRNMVQPAAFQASFDADIAESMNWARRRVQMAREKHGDGPAKLIIMSNGDPRNSSREMRRGAGGVLDAAKQLAEQRIQIYPIIINKASFGTPEEQVRLTSRDRTAEELMNSIASTTGGQAYQIREEAGFPDILMDIFGFAAQDSNDLAVSSYHWAVVAVGPALESVAIDPAAQTADTKPHTLTPSRQVDAASGIRTQVVASPHWQTTLIRRPATPSLVDRFWQGRWDLRSAGPPSGATARVYRVPDFLIRLEGEPESPWWRHEQVQLKARLLDRHADTLDSAGGGASTRGRGLAVRITADSADKASTFVLERGQWTRPGQLYTSPPFAVRVPGLYEFTCELSHAVGDVNIPLFRFARDLPVYSECVGMDILTATNAVLRDLSVTPVPAGPVDTQGGQQVYFRISAKGTFGAEPLSGVLHLDPLSQTEWTLRKDAQGNLTTTPVRLPEREDRITGWADVSVETFAGVRHIRLPDFELAYAPAPLRLECAFADSREALWAGEFHNQLVSVSAFPVFEPFLDATLAMFPETLPDIRLRMASVRSGMSQAMGPRSRLVGTPQAGGYKGRTVTATYALDSDLPVPPSDKCEVSFSGTFERLQGAVKTYAVVDPVAEGLFRWTVLQGPAEDRSKAVSDVLFVGEPVRFTAQWRADQQVTAVRFEVVSPGAAESALVAMPVAPGATQAALDQTVSGLVAGQTSVLYVYVTAQPPGADGPVHIKLQGGQFRAEDRRLVLEDVTVGDSTPTDISCYAWEPVQIPLRVVFSGYAADDARHSAMIEQFKNSCVLTVTSRVGDVRTITETIEWTAITPVKTQDAPPGTCELTGHATYTSELSGRAAVELKAAFGTGQRAAQAAYAHLFVKEPRLALSVQKLTPTGAEVVFDSPTWVKGDTRVAPSASRFSTRFQVDVRNTGWTVSMRPQAWNVTVRVLRRVTADADWVAESSEAKVLAGDDVLAQQIQITADGEYAIEIDAQDPDSGQLVAHVRTPVITSIQQHEVVPVVAPPAWLTPHVRVWPFEYRVTLHQDATDLTQPDAVAFQFQLPGQDGLWLEGAASVVQPTDPQAPQLSVKGPKFLPPLAALGDGTVRFKLASQGLEFLRWEYANVRVVSPVLEKLTLSRESGSQEIASDGGELTLDGSNDLWVRPVFRATPELEGRWVRQGSTVYLWHDRGGALAGGQIPAGVLAELTERGTPGVQGGDIRVFTIGSSESDKSVKVLSRRLRWRFWGWPQRGTTEKFVLAAAVTYRAERTSGSASETPAGAATGQVIAEWSKAQSLRLEMPWVIPWCWWCLAVVCAAMIIVRILKMAVPRPDRLALDMRLEENVAVIQPARVDNPVQLDLRETSFRSDLELYTRYLCSRWDMAGRRIAQGAESKSTSVVGVALGALLRTMAVVVAAVRVCVRRCLSPRRWAWATIVPRTRGDARCIRAGLLCVWTGLGARNGRVWSSESGLLDLPRAGQTGSINLSLAYEMDRVERTMRVTVRVRRVPSEGIQAVTEDRRETDFDV